MPTYQIRQTVSPLAVRRLNGQQAEALTLTHRVAVSYQRSDPVDRRSVVLRGKDGASLVRTELVIRESCRCASASNESNRARELLSTRR